MAKFFDKYLSYIVLITIIAVVISKRSNTVSVIQTMASAMGNILGSITKPVSETQTSTPVTKTTPPLGAMTPPSGSTTEKE